MTDSTAVFHKVSEAFRSSVIYMSQNPFTAVGDDALVWAESPLYKVLVAIVIVLFLANLKNLYYCIPTTVDACFKTKSGILINTRPSLRKARNLSASISILIICIILFRLGYIKPAIIYLISRETIYILARIKTKNEELKYGHSSILNFYIPLSFIVFATYCILTLCEAGNDAIITALAYIGGVFWLVSAHRERQFFKLFCNSFYSFLYLCTLEIIPIALSIIWVK